MQATARIFYQSAPAKRTRDNLCPVKLCITHRRVRKYYSIAEKVKKNEWQFLSDDEIEKVSGKDPRGRYRNIRDEFKRIVDEAEQIINNIHVFSFAQFEEKYFNKIATWDKVFSAIWFHTQELKEESRFGYASSFESLLRSVKEFHTGKQYKLNPRKDKIETRKELYLSGKELRFVDISPTWLKRFERWLQEKGKSRSTIGIYMRNIRVIFNLAIKKHGVKAEYPFYEYKPMKSSGRKIALNAQEISKIVNYQTEDAKLEFFRDIFLFSFLANGMNLTDIARLRYSNIDNDEIIFEREKTKRYIKDSEEDGLIRIALTEGLKRIIEKHGNKVIGHDGYVFPIFKPEWSEARKFAEVKQLVKMVNLNIRFIAKKVGIKERISSYTARHSWATISKNSGASTEFIKEALGHSNVTVTERYLKSFEKSTRKEHAEKMERAVTGQNAV